MGESFLEEDLGFAASRQQVRLNPLSVTGGQMA
jgi:hypothetical protein